MESRGVERVGSNYSPAAQELFLDSSRGSIAWRTHDREFGSQGNDEDGAGGANLLQSLLVKVSTFGRRAEGRRCRDRAGANDDVTVAKMTSKERVGDAVPPLENLVEIIYQPKEPKGALGTRNNQSQKEDGLREVEGVRAPSVGEGIILCGDRNKSWRGDRDEGNVFKVMQKWSAVPTVGLPQSSPKSTREACTTDSPLASATVRHPSSPNLVRGSGGQHPIFTSKRRLRSASPSISWGFTAVGSTLCLEKDSVLEAALIANNDRNRRQCRANCGDVEIGSGTATDARHEALVEAGFKRCTKTDRLSGFLFEGNVYVSKHDSCALLAASQLWEIKYLFLVAKLLPFNGPLASVHDRGFLGMIDSPCSPRDVSWVLFRPLRANIVPHFCTRHVVCTNKVINITCFLCGWAPEGITTT